MRPRRGRAREELRLGFVRFRKLLEDARGLAELVADARDKAGGEYIFDRQYIVAMVDEAIALAGHLVFHAHVLAPGRSGAVDRMLDAIRRAGRALLAAPSPRADPVSRAASTVEAVEDLPEFRLLGDVIAWLDGPALPDHPTVLQLMDEVFDLAGGCLAAMVDLDLAADRRIVLGGRDADVVDVIDLGRNDGRGGTAAGALAGGLGDGPLRLIAHGAGSPGDDGGIPQRDAPARAAGRGWLAAVDGRRLDLLGGRGRSRIHVGAVLTGDPGVDYLFVGSIGEAAGGSIIPPSLRSRRTPQGRIAWLYGVRSRDLEDGLLHLGRALFGEPGAQAGGSSERG